MLLLLGFSAVLAGQVIEDVIDHIESRDKPDDSRRLAGLDGCPRRTPQRIERRPDAEDQRREREQGPGKHGFQAVRHVGPRNDPPQ